MMKSIILLRFHKELEIVQNRIDLLHHFNKNIGIYGLFGGRHEEYSVFKNGLKGIQNISFLDIPDRDTKWKYSDLCILDWYKNGGNELDFDTVYTIEYDLLLLDQLKNLFTLPANSIALTGLIKLKDISENWDWLSATPLKESSESFLKYMSKNYGITDPFACLGPGTVLTKDFLEGYRKMNIPLFGHDELRLPQIATALGIKIVDTGFYDNWNSRNPKTESFFNCNEEEIEIAKIIDAYKDNVRKVFHPVYKEFPLKLLGLPT